jgi:hypothetical protein
MSIRGNLENAIVKLLAPLVCDQDGGYAALIMPYAGSINPGREDEDWQRATQGAHPAILVSSIDGQYDNRTMGRNADYVLDILILVGSSQVASQVAATQGDNDRSVDPGIFKMIDDVRDRLFNRPLSNAPGACTLRPISDSPILRAPDRQIWGLSYQARVDAIENDLEEFDGDYLILGSQINFPTSDPGVAINPLLQFDQTVNP